MSSVRVSYEPEIGQLCASFRRICHGAAAAPNGGYLSATRTQHRMQAVTVHSVIEVPADSARTVVSAAAAVIPLIAVAGWQEDHVV